MYLPKGLRGDQAVAKGCLGQDMRAERKPEGWGVVAWVPDVKLLFQTSIANKHTASCTAQPLVKQLGKEAGHPVREVPWITDRLNNSVFPFPCPNSHSYVLFFCFFFKFLNFIFYIYFWLRWVFVSV